MLYGIEKLELANLPTPIERLVKVSRYLNKNIYIKRDDYTGFEFSGNKIRKLEFSLKEALEKGANHLITCGALQSNHARATACVAAKLGLSCTLILKGNESDEIDGNYLLDKLFGAEIIFISADEYAFRRNEIMKNIKENLEKLGIKPYIIPEGASNGIGTLGYVNCFEEILIQEKKLNIEFDSIVVPVGSGGTYSGLYIGNQLHRANKKIIGFNVSSTAEHFVCRVSELIDETVDILPEKINICKKDINIIDGYVGRGYSISRVEELEFIKKIAQSEGFLLDPVYSGKAFYGLFNENLKGRFKGNNNILFIHTGGQFGLFPKKDVFEL
ncbi:MAG: D-cysteine desulfhydrase family protein [Tissierellales bacterium]|nr:D-cysteine desulfhydrase family protein [Tissierellales bacterium]